MPETPITRGSYCGVRLPPPPNQNEWKACVLELGHNCPHKSVDGTRWPREEQRGTGKFPTLQ